MNYSSTVVRACSLVFCACAFLALPASASTTDMVHLWGFEEGTGRSVGDTAGGQNGAFVGTAAGFGWASGKVGTGLAMTGTTGEGIALPNGFLKGGQGTVSLWLDMNELSDGNVIFSGRSVSDRYIYATLSIDRDGRPLFQFRDSASGYDRRVQGTRLIGKNEWVNLVFIANGQGYRFFVNGEEATVAGDNIGRWFPDVTNQTLMYRIGTADTSGVNGSFNGYLDDLRIYGRALSVSEVTTLFEEGNAASPTIPAGYAPKLDFTISSGEIAYGDSVALRWSTERVDSCAASGSWNGSVATSGTQVMIKLADDASYQLKCSNKYGSVDASVRVHVLEKGSASTSSTTSQGTLTVEPIVVAPTMMGSVERQALIDRLMAEIVALIGELQKKIVEMQAAGAR